MVEEERESESELHFFLLPPTSVCVMDRCGMQFYSYVDDKLNTHCPFSGQLPVCFRKVGGVDLSPTLLECELTNEKRCRELLGYHILAALFPPFQLRRRV